MYPFNQQNTFIYYRRFKLMPPIPFSLSHLFLYITNPIIIPSLFTFTHLLQSWIITSLVHSTQSDLQYLVEQTRLFLTFPRGHLVLIKLYCSILIVLHHIQLSSFLIIPIFIIYFSFRLCLFEKGISLRYSVTIRTQVLKVKWYHSQGIFVLPGCIVDFMKKSPYYSRKGIVVGFMNCQAITRDFGPLGNESESWKGMDVNCPVGHLCNVYSVQPHSHVFVSLINKQSDSSIRITTIILFVTPLSYESIKRISISIIICMLFVLVLSIFFTLLNMASFPHVSMLN